ncbi:hypothetical protein C8R43DRAFT_119063 [Mycena crocata]|nr:hypothetical protein C8R43DRAFT_119063 [Mycena crocata]
MYFGRRHQSHHKLSRTVVQTYVLCALGFPWIFFVLGVVSLNSSGDICGWNRRSCGLFTAAHFLSWVLVVVLFSAAYATYRRAVAFHGSTIVPVASSVAAWRISGVAEGPGGYIKIEAGLPSRIFDI